MRPESTPERGAPSPNRLHPGIGSPFLGMTLATSLLRCLSGCAGSMAPGQLSHKPIMSVAVSKTVTPAVYPSASLPLGMANSPW